MRSEPLRTSVELTYCKCLIAMKQGETIMKLLCVLFPTIGLLTAFSVSAWSDDRVLRADTMVGVDGPFVGTANPIRGVAGGGLPWVLDEAKVELDRDGKLKVEVEGLIIPVDDGFGFNPAPFFRAIVSCLSVDDGGNVVTVNVMTTNDAEVMEGDPLNGDAKIETDIELPTPCIAPIVFVTSPEGSWFSATGQMSADDPANSSHNSIATAESVMEGDSSGVGAISLPFFMLFGLAAFWIRRRSLQIEARCRPASRRSRPFS